MFKPSRRQVNVLWLLGLVFLLALIGRPCVSRSQEARVLVTAREMHIADSWRAWIIPHINGEVRLHKPPLAYWLAAAGFKLFDVSEGAARLGFAIAGWLLLAVTFCIARWLFLRRVGLLAGAILASSFLFLKFARLAETDVLVSLFVTLGIYACWRGVMGEVAPGDAARAEESSDSNINKNNARNGSLLWFALAGVATGLALMSKGLPAAYVPLFFLALVIAERRWRALLPFLVITVPIAAAIGAPWFLYVRQLPQWARTSEKELDDLMGGADHPGSWLNHAANLLLKMMPWIIPALGALVWSLGRLMSDWRARGLLIWVAVIFVPLCLIGNKQDHYLLPLLPALAVLAAWGIDQFAHERDWLRRGVLWTSLVLCTLMVAALGHFAPRSEHPNANDIAQRVVTASGPGPYLFFAPPLEDKTENISFPLIFALRQVAPQVRTQFELDAMTEQQPRLPFLRQIKNGKAAALETARYERLPVIEAKKQSIEIWRRKPTTNPASPAKPESFPPTTNPLPPP